MFPIFCHQDMKKCNHEHSSIISSGTLSYALTERDKILWYDIWVEFLISSNIETEIMCQFLFYFLNASKNEYNLENNWKLTLHRQGLNSRGSLKALELKWRVAVTSIVVQPFGIITPAQGTSKNIIGYITLLVLIRRVGERGL